MTDGGADSGEKEEFEALFNVTQMDVEPIQQHITKLENGRLFTINSPRELGSQLIRLYVYDIRDTTKKDKRNWRRHARVRTQFLSTSSSKDRKLQLLQQLLDVTANDIRKISGCSKKMRTVYQDS